MPDISMCSDQECPSRMECYRFRAIAGEFQWYGPYHHDDGDKCESFVPIEGRRVREIAE